MQQQFSAILLVVVLTDLYLRCCSFKDETKTFKRETIYLKVLQQRIMIKMQHIFLCDLLLQIKETM